jgi:hypothetical protein
MFSLNEYKWNAPRSVGVASPSLAGEIDKRWSNERNGQAGGLLIFVNTRSGRECGKFLKLLPCYWPKKAYIGT